MAKISSLENELTLAKRRAQKAELGLVFFLISTLRKPLEKKW